MDGVSLNTEIYVYEDGTWSYFNERPIDDNYAIYKCNGLTEAEIDSLVAEQLAPIVQKYFNEND